MTAIYILDDDPCILASLEALVRHMFHVEIKTFFRADELFSQIDASAAGVLLVDHQMPGSTGVDVIRTLALRDHDRLATILMSGFVDASLIDAAKAAGASGVIEKPCSADTLRRVIERSLPQLRPRSPRERLAAPATTPQPTGPGVDWPAIEMRPATGPAPAPIDLADGEDFFAQAACAALVDRGHGADRSRTASMRRRRSGTGAPTS
jgi:CheY-like chemotaxis protein